ncbi:MAG: NUDIX hydrolase [Rhodomicrobium sp.]|nr:MAG: NUDIX hydrolase [Rhodomicrobium sp.]
MAATRLSEWSFAMFDRLKHLSGVDRSKEYPVVTPRDAASLIIVDRRPPSPSFLMGRRSKRQSFMPGVFVFPGGALEQRDITTAEALQCLPQPAGFDTPPLANLAATAPLGAGPCTAESPLHAHTTLMRGTALAICALREFGEETGLSFNHMSAAPPSQDTSLDKAPLWSGADNGLPDMKFLARAITPPGRRMRYDTRFLLTEIEDDLAPTLTADDEFTELKWVDYETAISALPLHAMTRVIIEDLKDYLFGSRETSSKNEQICEYVPFYRYSGKEFKRERIEIETLS